MPTTVVVPRRKRLRAGQALGWIVAALAVIAVIVLIVLLTRANDRVTTVERQSEEQVTTLRRQLRGAEAQARLSSLQASLRSGAEAGSEALVQQYESIMEDLRENYADAEGRSLETWNAIRDDLEMVGDQIRENTQEAANTLDGVLARLNADAE